MSDTLLHRAVMVAQEEAAVARVEAEAEAVMARVEAAAAVVVAPAHTAVPKDQLRRRE
jgi:hypothetical protein